LAGLLGAFYCPRDGYATPEAMVQGYAIRGGAWRLDRQSCAVTGLCVAGSRITVVDTTKGTIETDTTQARPAAGRGAP
jgi:sarcosine oxidase subunit beta